MLRVSACHRNRVLLQTKLPYEAYKVIACRVCVLQGSKECFLRSSLEILPAVGHGVASYLVDMNAISAKGIIYLKDPPGGCVVQGVYWARALGFWVKDLDASCCFPHIVDTANAGPASES